jgi:hypothetical protein
VAQHGGIRPPALYHVYLTLGLNISPSDLGIMGKKGKIKTDKMTVGMPIFSFSPLE